MKIASCTLISLLLTFSLFGQENVRKVDLKDKQTKVQRTYYVLESDASIKHGLFVLRYGGLQMSGHYKHNKRDGSWTFTNNVVIKGQYKDGLKVGKWIYLRQQDTISILNFNQGEFEGKQFAYFDNGNVASILNYDTGNANGIQYEYHETGGLKEMAVYTNGMQEGQRLMYSEDGNSVSRIDYFRGNPIHLEVLKGESLLTAYKGDLAHGTGRLENYRKDDQGNDVLLSVRNYKDSLLHGDIIGYNYKGDSAFTGLYNAGFMVGEWKFYNLDGELDHANNYSFSDSLRVDPNEPVIANSYRDFRFVDHMPEFRGGQLFLSKFLGNSVQYPKECFAKRIQGKVFVQFVISMLGEIEQVKVVKSVHPLLDEEACRVVREMPNWVPGFQNGRPVKVSYTIPINFVLQ